MNKWWETNGENMVPDVSDVSGRKRYWMKRETEKMVIFLDEKPSFFYFEHQVKIGNNFRNYATCLRMLKEPCKLCSIGERRYEAAAFTVLDCTEWTDKEKKVHSFTKRLYIAKRAAWEKIERQYRHLAKKDLSLRGALFAIARGAGDKSPTVGDDFNYEEHVELSELTGVNVDVFDYGDMLKPDVGIVNSFAEQLALFSDEPTVKKANFDV